ncbi:hypothetical protein [Sporisorium scitamineum]|uniref:Uncharacterized protein n=1 Tax=Sporisorium scitamineum TaxID=49012 RepID=A0A0F7S6M1_9BASI|nr:hypothetical protein [Sporisorium scitamineum]
MLDADLSSAASHNDNGKPPDGTASSLGDGPVAVKASWLTLPLELWEHIVNFLLPPRFCPERCAVPDLGAEATQ